MYVFLSRPFPPLFSVVILTGLPRKKRLSCARLESYPSGKISRRMANTGKTGQSRATRHEFCFSCSWKVRHPHVEELRTTLTCSPRACPRSTDTRDGTADRFLGLEGDLGRP